MFVVRVREKCELWWCSERIEFKYCVCRCAGPLARCIGRAVVGFEGSLYFRKLISCGILGVSVGVSVSVPGTLGGLTVYFPPNLNFW